MTTTVAKTDIKTKMAWAERIPTAIAKVERLVAATLEEFEGGSNKFEPDWEKVADLGPDAVALAKALWDCWRNEYEGPGGLIDEPPDAFCAFVEKVEGL